MVMEMLLEASQQTVLDMVISNNMVRIIHNKEWLDTEIQTYTKSEWLNGFKIGKGDSNIGNGIGSGYGDGDGFRDGCGDGGGYGLGCSCDHSAQE
jgi:hypothetical protein